jgi:hypothetical protein
VAAGSAVQGPPLGSRQPDAEFVGPPVLRRLSRSATLPLPGCHGINYGNKPFRTGAGVRSVEQVGHGEAPHGDPVRRGGRPSGGAVPLRASAGRGRNPPAIGEAGGSWPIRGPALALAARSWRPRSAARTRQPQLAAAQGDNRRPRRKRVRKNGVFFLPASAGCQGPYRGRVAGSRMAAPSCPAGSPHDQEPATSPELRPVPRSSTGPQEPSRVRA